MLNGNGVLRGDLLANAFQAAWERALKDELVSATNVVDAPAGLLPSRAGGFSRRLS